MLNTHTVALPQIYRFRERAWLCSQPIRDAPTHHSSVIGHQSSLIGHHSSLITHRSSALIISHHSSVITHHSSLIAHRHSSLIGHRSSLILIGHRHSSLIGTHRSQDDQLYKKQIISNITAYGLIRYTLKSKIIQRPYTQ